MPYQAEISRTNPTFILFLIDQSGSMADTIPGKSIRKADGVADAINRLLQNLVIKCSKSEGVRDYFYLAAIGYGALVGPALGGTLAGREIVPISEVAVSPSSIEERVRKVEDGAGGLVDQTVKFPIWLGPVANNGTPMCQAALLAKQILMKWLAEHPNCFPPVVIHVTDGESTDGDPSESLRQLTEQASSDGNVLLLNLHLSSNPSNQPISFPTMLMQVTPDAYGQMLFKSASALTPSMLAVANKEHGLNLVDGAKGFVLNGDLALIITALDIGTRADQLR